MSDLGEVSMAGKTVVSTDDLRLVLDCMDELPGWGIDGTPKAEGEFKAFQALRAALSGSETDGE